MVAEQLQNVSDEIRKACEKSGRDPKEVTLIAVSKTKPISMIEEAMEAGQTIFGENKVQEQCRRCHIGHTWYTGTHKKQPGKRYCFYGFSIES